MIKITLPDKEAYKLVEEWKIKADELKKRLEELKELIRQAETQMIDPNKENE